MAKVLSEKFYGAMKTLEPRYPTKVALLLPALHAAQDEFGWLPAEVLDEIASYIGIHPAQVREVASFYTMYNLKPVGKNHLKICTNVACLLRGADKLVDFCERKLEIRCGETTADRKFTLHEEECLGACGTAPAMMFNDDYVENLDINKLNELLTKASADDAPGHGGHGGHR